MVFGQLAKLRDILHLTRKKTEQIEDDLVRELESIELSELPKVVERWRRHKPEMRGITFALDCAGFDILRQQTGEPLSRLLGGPMSGEVPEVLSLSAAPTEELTKRIAGDGGIRKIIQVKLGVGAVRDDVQCVKNVLSHLAEDQLLLADFGGVLPRTVALDALPEVDDPRLLWEEPCKTLEDNAILSNALNGRVMFDNCLSDIGAYQKAMSLGATAVVVKPALLGGLSVARNALDLSIAAKVKVRVDGPWSGALAAHAALSLAMSVPRDQMIGSINLTEPLDIETDLIVKTRPGWIGPGNANHES